MKTKRWVLIAVVVILLGMLLWWVRAKTASSNPDAAKQPVTTVQSSAGQVKNDSPPVEPAAVSAKAPLPPQPQSKREQMREILSKLNDKEIEFYGKVIDQFGTPIPGVNVGGSAIYNNGVSSGVQEKKTVTDAEGFFSFTGMRGRTFDCGLRKPGYQTMPEGDAWDYTELVPEEKRHHPDPKNPVILRMWKLQGAEPMIYFDRKSFMLPPDGAPVRIDLATGKKVSSGGDVIVTIEQPMAPPGERLTHYAWTAKITATGLQESTAKLMYLAPERGYTSALNYGENGNERVQEKQVAKSFYLKTADGRYARVSMDLTSDTNPERGSYVGLTWWLNPKPGSRNLEFDPAKLATAPTSKP